ncbi:hypothetical protein DFH11DRAFT_1511497 [Phellopilus nigrolimitatus]|nr:hypothetical protein DFH11DRAFT_1511497 [Phellopilus nigrolimitatus]
MSRQPSAGPSNRPKPRRKVNIIPDDDVIVLSDSDDGLPVPPRPRKRQKTGKDSSRAIDLTDVDVGPSRPFQREVSVLSLSSGSSGSQQKLFTTNNTKTLDKPLHDLTNEQRYGATQDEAPVSAVNNVARDEAVNPIDEYLSQILEVVPDVQPEHVVALITQHLPAYGDQVVMTVLHLLFESPYPKVQRNKGKRKQDADDAESRPPAKAPKKDYGTRNRPYEGGAHYIEMSINQLMIDFPYIPLPHLRHTLVANNRLYAPTHLSLREQLKQIPRPFKVKSTASKVAGKGKDHDAEFERELAWLLEMLQGGAPQSNAQTADEDEECEDGIECGCCFSHYAFDKMVQCPDAHLFCSSCMTSYVENLLGQHDPNIKCMDQSGCKVPFSDTELARFLSPKLLNLYHRVKQTREIEAAGLDGLEECPFCEYKVVIENPEEKLFRCEREECSAVSCRSCKKLDHLPKSCKEAESDKGSDARHQIEEAMTGALMRNCPKCKKPFVKESGCNKMTCPHCRTLSCYICRQIITSYDHFDSVIGNRQGSSANTKCNLWDPVEKRHDEEVAMAREKAMQEVREENPELDSKDLEVELPKTAPAAVARAQLPAAQPMLFGQGGRMAAWGGQHFGIDLGLPFGMMQRGLVAAREQLGLADARRAQVDHQREQQMRHDALREMANAQHAAQLRIAQQAAARRHVQDHPYPFHFGDVQMPGLAPPPHLLGVNVNYQYAHPAPAVQAAVPQPQEAPPLARPRRNPVRRR